MGCVTVALVVEQIVEVQHSNGKLKKRITENLINTFLDVILEIKKCIDDISSNIDIVYELLEEHFNELDKENYDGELKKTLHKFITDHKKYYVSLRCDKKVYPLVKASVKNMHESILSLQEICEDIETFKIKLPENEEFKRLEALLNAL